MSDMLRNNRIVTMKDRMKETSNWFPLPAAISFALVLIFTGHLLININPRLGSSSDIIKLETQRQKEGSIWLSVFQKEGNIYVTTFDRKVFSWKSSSVQNDGMKDFEDYLHGISLENATQAAISKFSTKSQTEVILAVDQRLNYFHIRPIIHSLAKAGIDTYGFETQLVNKELSEKASQDYLKFKNNKAKF